MVQEKQTVMVQLESPAAQQVARAAQLTNQSPDTFLAKVGEAVAHRILLGDAADRWLREERTFSELAAETGLWIEELMEGVAQRNADRALEASLDDWSALATAHQHPELPRLAEQAAAAVRNAG